MDYADALASFYNRYGAKGFKDAFFARSVLLDSVAGSIMGKRLVDVLYALCQTLDVVALFRSKGLEKGRQEIAGVYNRLEGGFTKREVVEAVNPLSALLCPKEYARAARRAPQQGPVAVSKSQRPASKSQSGVAIHKREAAVKTNTEKKPVLPAKGPKRNPFPIKKIEICTNAKRLFFQCGDVDSVEIAANGKTLLIDYSKFVVGKDSILLPIDLPKRSVTVTLPKKRYSNLTIDGVVADIQGNIPDDRAGVKSLIIKSQAGSVSYNGGRGRVSVYATKNVTLFGAFDSVTVKTKHGKTELSLLPNPKGKARVHVRVSYGQFKGRLVQDKLRRPIGGLFRRRYCTKFVAVSKNMTLDLDIKAGKGLTFR